MRDGVLAATPAITEGRDTLSIAPGAPEDPDHFGWIGYKGGSEVGVLTLTLLVEHMAGRPFVVSIGTNEGEAEAVHAVALLTAKVVASLADLRQPIPPIRRATSGR